MIEIENVSMTRQGNRILDDATLALPKGGMTALIGPNGAGKSSLLSLIARLQPLEGGRILVDGLSVATTASRVLAKKLSILRQEGIAAGRLRVRELVAFGALAPFLPEHRHGDFLEGKPRLFHRQPAAQRPGGISLVADDELEQAFRLPFRHPGLVRDP